MPNNPETKSHTTHYVLDATMGWPPCFCPANLDKNGQIISIVFGMNIITDHAAAVRDGKVDLALTEKLNRRLEAWRRILENGYAG